MRIILGGGRHGADVVPGMPVVAIGGVVDPPGTTPMHQALRNG
jgi:hypothetical protein